MVTIHGKPERIFKQIGRSSSTSMICDSSLQSFRHQKKTRNTLCQIDEMSMRRLVGWLGIHMNHGQKNIVKIVKGNNSTIQNDPKCAMQVDLLIVQKYLIFGGFNLIEKMINDSSNQIAKLLVKLYFNNFVTLTSPPSYGRFSVAKHFSAAFVLTRTRHPSISYADAIARSQTFTA